jgi:purine-binding chemotaxis protein CheW
MAKDTTPEFNPDDDEQGIEQDQYLVFTTMGQEFGIQAMRIQEISAMVGITKVPKAPPYIEGILNLRGRLMSILNFRKKVGFEPKGQDEDTRLIIVEHAGFPIGIMVDSVEEVIRIPAETVQKMPEATATTLAAEYINGVGILNGRLVILLDAEKVLNKSERAEVDAIRRGADASLYRAEIPEMSQPGKMDLGTAAQKQLENPQMEGR